jgi:hypothetical protein
VGSGPFPRTGCFRQATPIVIQKLCESSQAQHGRPERTRRTLTSSDARDILYNALAQDLILDGVDDPDGFQVMTIHKAKGNQFDGAIVLRRQRRDGKQIASNSSGVMMLLHIEEAERS